MVPQTDRIGKKRAWQLLQELPVGPLDSGPHATFKWWLWLANLGAETRTVLGDGVVAASLLHSDVTLKKVTFVRIDNTTITVQEVVVGV